MIIEGRALVIAQDTLEQGIAQARASGDAQSTERLNAELHDIR